VEGSCEDEVFVGGKFREALGVVLVVDETSSLVDDVDGKDHGVLLGLMKWQRCSWV
jgi:hypothetical protein